MYTFCPVILPVVGILHWPSYRTLESRWKHFLAYPTSVLAFPWAVLPERATCDFFFFFLYRTPFSTQPATSFGLAGGKTYSLKVLPVSCLHSLYTLPPPLILFCLHHLLIVPLMGQTCSHLCFLAFMDPESPKPHCLFPFRFYLFRGAFLTTLINLQPASTGPPYHQHLIAPERLYIFYLFKNILFDR